ncbi:hypothetical protein ACFL20_12785 [Spirochaetota bacterium]
MKQNSQKCAVCTKPITKKPIKRMGKLYCSFYCSEVNRERMENLDLEKVNFDELGDVIGNFMNTCKDCVMPIKCRKVRDICSHYFDELHDHISTRWCCHAIFGLSCMLSDGSVEMETVKTTIAKAEDIVRENGYVGVSPCVLSMAEGELVGDFRYVEREDYPPPPPEEMHEHYLACLNCEKDFMDECLELTQIAEDTLPEIDEMFDFPYCGHCKYDLAAMLQNPKVSKGKIKGIVDKARKVAKEKKYQGGQYRIHYLTLARSIQGEGIEVTVPEIHLMAKSKKLVENDTGKIDSVTSGEGAVEISKLEWTGNSSKMFEDLVASVPAPFRSSTKDRLNEAIMKRAGGEGRVTENIISDSVREVTPKPFVKSAMKIVDALRNED